METEPHQALLAQASPVQAVVAVAEEIRGHGHLAAQAGAGRALMFQMLEALELQTRAVGAGAAALGIRAKVAATAALA